MKILNRERKMKWIAYRKHKEQFKNIKKIKKQNYHTKNR